MDDFPERDSRNAGFGDLAYSPSGGRGTQLIVGIGLALIPAILGAWGIWQRKAFFLGRGDGMWIEGEPALWLSGVYLGVAAFVHFHWYWGLVPAWRISQTGKGIACGAILVCFGRCLYLMIV